MLRGCKTSLKFDGYTSDQINIENGIGQGDPLSMVLYQYYNADLVEIPHKKGEAAMAYVDNTIMIASAKTFPEAHDKLADMMARKGGITEWSTSHNSPLKHSKLALLDFAHKTKQAERNPLTLEHSTVKPSASTKYLGVLIDKNLNWKAQIMHALGKGTKWVMQVKRIARPTWGIMPHYAKRLYQSMAIPRMLYAAEIWASQVKGKVSTKQGTSTAIKHLTTLQRAGAIVITGGLQTSPTDTLDASAYLMPAALYLER